MESSLLKLKKASTDRDIISVKTELFVAKVKCATLRWTRVEVLLKLKLLETDLRDSLKVLSERTTERFRILSKQFETEAAQGIKKIFVHFKHETAKVSDVLETFL